MKKKILSILQYAIFMGLGIFLLWWSLRKLSPKDWQDVKNAIAGANYWIIVPVVIALLLSHFSRALRWKILMEPLGYKTRISNTYLAVLIGYFANLAIPRLGEVLKCTVLAKYEKVPADKLVGTIVAERAFDLICLTIVMTIAFLSQIDVIGDYFSGFLMEHFGSKAAHFSFIKILTLVVLAGTLVLVAWYVIKRFSHVSFIQKCNQILKGIWQGLTSVRYVKNKGWFFFHTVFIWAMYLLSVQMGMWSMHETSHYGIKSSLSVLSTGSIAMILTPSGIGTYHFFVAGTMEAYGLDYTFGIAFGLLLWSVQFFQILISGFVALILLPYLNKQKVHAPG
jgi:hypothetical protein